MGMRRRGARACALLAGIAPMLACAGPRIPAAGDEAAAGPVAPTEAVAPRAIRVLVYNIHAGRDAAGQENLAQVSELVRSAGADVVLLQEVDRGTRRSGGVDQVAVLERLTGFHGAFGRTLDYQGGGYGIAVLSRWPIVSDTLVSLEVEPPQERAGGSYEPRGVQVVVVDAPGPDLVALNTHLDASATDTYRRQEVETVLAAAARFGSERRTVVGGDFNAEPGSAPIARMLEAGWTDAWRGCGAGAGRTYPADAPVKRIDYLFLGPGVSCDSATVIPTRTSDHRPVLVVLTFERR